MLTPEGEYKEEYILEAPNVDEKVCYLNLVGSPKWMSMYDILISKFGVCIPFTHFQFAILEQTGIALSQLHLNS